LTKWWSDNWGYVVAGIIAALVAFVAAEIFTGGAITAALPVIMPILEYVFAGIAIAQFGTYFVDFLEKSWKGDVKGGTKALSRGIGAALIELAMYLGFGALKLVGKAVKTVAKGAVAVGKQVAKTIIRGAKFIIEKGKVLFKGIVGKGLGKLTKSLRKLGDKILEHTRFKKIILRIRGKSWEILAEINPLFVIMSGPMPDEIGEIIKIESDKVGKGLKKGETMIDEEGREVMKVSNLEKFEKTPDYREIFELYNKKGISGDVIHHLIEKNSRYANLFEKELINAPKSLRAIPKGSINEVLHLSNIRKGWDRIYRVVDDLLRRGGTSQQAKDIIIGFAKKSDVYIQKCLEAIIAKEAQIGRALTKTEIAAITDNLMHLLN
jgi:hypothetical protein